MDKKPHRFPDDAEAMRYAHRTDTASLTALAGHIRDEGFRNLVTYSANVFIPLTHLCRNSCHYCTFSKTQIDPETPYMPVEQVLHLARKAAALGAKEALFTLGDKPELRHLEARKALDRIGFKSTIEYLAHVARRVFEETGLLPHINAGVMGREEMVLLRPVSASMGIMLESVSVRLCAKDMPHHGSPDKLPAARLETLRLGGEARIPFTTGILIGIGETREERIQSFLSIRKLHASYGHIQEIIIQNFRAKEGTRMAAFPEPDLEDLIWTVAVARILFGPGMSIQVPPNLNPGALRQIIGAGANDWGGVSSVTSDFVNPEAPWPHVDPLAAETAFAGKVLQQRLTIYPAYALEGKSWLASGMRIAVLRMMDAEGFPRNEDWQTGKDISPPEDEVKAVREPVSHDRISPDLCAIVLRAEMGESLAEADVVRLFQSRGPEFAYVCQQANRLRRQVNGDAVSYVVNRNISYTNVCRLKCRFCAFSKGKRNGNPEDSASAYDLDHGEIARRIAEAWDRGCTEVCMQGGIHPEYTGQTYLDILATAHSAAPDMHIHAFSPQEVWEGARSLGLPVESFLEQLKMAGLNSLPGTAAEVLDDEVRSGICPDKVDTLQWLDVIESAHRTGLKTTATIMFGHVDRLHHWARHLLRIRDLQRRTGGFTEFVPLPFVPDQTPAYLEGIARKGPTFRECVLMHSVARLVLHGQIGNIQTSWVKMGEKGVSVALHAGANDVGGTLMNESITRSAGATNGQEKLPRVLENLILAIKRRPRQRTTLYGDVTEERVQASYMAPAKLKRYP